MSIVKWLGTYSGRAGNKNKSKIDTVSLMKIHQKENMIVDDHVFFAGGQMVMLSC